MNGGVYGRAEVVGRDDERPEERDEPDEGRHHDDRPVARPRSSDRRQPAPCVISSPASSSAARHLRDGEVVERREDLRDLRRERRRRDDDVGGRPVGDDLAVGQHDDPVGGRRDELDVVGGDRRPRGPSAARSSTTRDQRRAWPRSRGRGSARRAGPRCGAARSWTASTSASRWPSDRSRGCGRRRRCRARAGRAALGRRGRPGPDSAVGLVALGADACRGRAGRPASAAPGRPAARGCGRERLRIAARRPRPCRPAACRCPGSPTAATTCRSRCGPSAR